jgi:glycerol kinase
MEKLFLGIDQGSSSTKAVLLDMHGQHHQEFSVSVSTHFEEDKIEQSPKELLQSLRTVADDALRFAHRQKRQVVGIGLSVQRSGVCAWERASGEVVHPLISHRDTRTRERISLIASMAESVQARTGLPLTAHYAGSKIAQLQEQFSDSEILVSTLDSYLAQLFTGDTRFITDDSMAARTLLYDLERGRWSSELCSLFGVSEERLPSVRPSLSQHGTYRGIPLRALLGDQQAGLFGRLAEGVKVVLNLGTISSVCVCTGHEIVRQNGFVSSVLFSTGEHERELTFLLEGITSSSGAICDLLVRKLELAQSLDSLDQLCHSAVGEAPIAYLPIGGAGTPFWRHDLPALVQGKFIERSAEFARAAVEHIGASIAANLLALKHSGVLPHDLGSIVVSGGISDLNFLLQYIADVSGFELVRLSSREGGARGAAIAALAQMVGGRITLPRDRTTKIFSSHAAVSKQRYAEWCRLRDQSVTGQFDPALLYTAHDLNFRL